MKGADAYQIDPLPSTPGALFCPPLAIERRMAYAWIMQPPAAGSHAQAVRLTAHASLKRSTGIAMVLGLNLLVVALGTASAALPDEIRMAVLIPVFVVAGGAFMFLMVRRRKVMIDVDRERVVVDGGSGGVFSTSGAALGPWRTAGLGVISGSVLHLQGGSGAYRIGGSDHGGDASFGAAAPPCEQVDVTLPLADFQALLALVPRSARPAPVAGEAVVRCQLLRNPATARSGFMTILPWFGTIAVVIAVNLVLDATGLFDTIRGQYTGAAIVFPILLAGMALTGILALRKNPKLEIVFDVHDIRVVNASNGRTLAAAPRSHAASKRGVWRFTSRAGSYVYPTISIAVPGYRVITLCVYDERFLWKEDVKSVSAPRFIVGAPDWARLVELLRFD